MVKILVTGGAAVSIEHVPYDKAYGEGFEDRAHRVPDIRKAVALTGHEPPVTLDEALACIRDWGRG